MRCVAALVMALTLVPAVCLAENSPVPRTTNSATPTQGVDALNLEEMWRVGGEDEDVIFGQIVDVKRDHDGNTYVLDNQLCQVVVISPEGEHLNDLSREGDGPGELRQPVELLLLPDDTLGVGMGYPGKIVTMKKDGTPITSLFPVGDPADGAFALMMGIKHCNGLIVACGGRMTFNETGEGHTDRFLAVTDTKCSEVTHVFEKTTPLDLRGLTYNELEDYYVTRCWTIDSEGQIYVAAQRNAYEISVFNKSGKLERLFERPYKQRKRTEAEKDGVNSVIRVNDGNGVVDIDRNIEDHDECISRLMFNHDQNTLWVQTPHGTNDQPDEILETWDVFSPEGKFIKQVTIPLGKEMNSGASFLVGDNHLIIVRGSNDDAPAEDEEAELEYSELEPLEVICYKIK